jgi:tetratricopeptide (TPR) repeat protein/CO dehydrogenase nickel-insertion accessory protein CooC1
MGQIVTFYSFKGGVGRSMAVANVAILLMQWGHRVLIVDWDLEAPGMEAYFKGLLATEKVPSQEGVVDLLWDVMQPSLGAEKKSDWKSLVVNIELQETKGSLHLLTAGKRDDQYFKKVRGLDFQEFYHNQQGGLFIESLREAWKKDYDYVLLDSRTGITDIGGICTIQLPDILVSMFTATEQSLMGVVDVAKRVQVAQQTLPFDRLNIACVPIPARFDTQTEFKISQEWLDRFSLELVEIYKDWLPASISRRAILEITKIPYLSYFSFGEKLPVLEQSLSDPTGLGYAYETLAALLANNLELIENLVQDRESFVRLARKEKLQRPIKISLAKLPSTDSFLIGREQELAMLDSAWGSPLSEHLLLESSQAEDRQSKHAKINIISLVAFAGVGKTALVNKWLSQLAQDNYRGAERVFGWSFYSQGAAEGRQIAADSFIAAALNWFGDPDSTAGSPWDKGERLAELVKQQRTLLILDGLEPLQNPPPVEPGRIKDPALRSLLRELARHNPGLVIITTRLVVNDLNDFVGGAAIEINLDHLFPEAGAALLKHLGVMGADEELLLAAEEYRGHALALTLLGTYLATAYRGDVRQRDKIERLTDERKQGAHGRRVMAAYEHWLKDKPELDILRLMGLFDQPVERGALEVLRKEPAIKGLTERVQKLSHADWQYAVKNLRDLRLVSDEDPHDPEALDCHPFLHEHFAEQLRVSNPNAWHEAHSRLYEHYKSSTKEFPDTLEEMSPLFAAVAHGCQAGRYQEVLAEVYWQRILRGEEYFSVNKLGAFGATLATLSGFFDLPWQKPIERLAEDSKSFVLGLAGFLLRALGRLTEATDPMRSSLEAHIAQELWKAAAVTAGNLSELYLTIGNVTQALGYARQSVELADRSDDALQQTSGRAALADVLHQVGSFGEAETVFRQAEEMQKSTQPELPLLYSLRGFRYCDLLLSQGKYQDVQSRAAQTLELVGDKYWLLGVALDYLSLGRAHLMKAQVEGVNNYSQATTYLDRAVDGLRQAGEQEFLVRGLLARTGLYRVMGALDKARRDLDEAFSIAARGGMRLHEADCHLEYARLFVANGELDKMRESLARAKKMIEEMGYHRRNSEYQRIFEQIHR